MYLRRLDIQGFKSFADKISLDFSSGITSVVGPNGSGKSNIADAIRWVLGEQSAKTLRGSKMEDVIFAGTEQRRPLGFSEVSITIDNSDGTLPVEYSEVTITRRVFRSGESEYFINKTSCRLKDINEMFFDTGLGKDGYSVIGQGRVDEILSSKSEDRRRIFEEASGIMKYKIRRQESEKKLELTHQNLLRIKDIIEELEKQLEPLKTSSEVAKKYLNLREKLKELEVSLYVENITKLKEDVIKVEKQISLVKENIVGTNHDLESFTKAHKQKNDFTKIIDEKLDKTKQEFYNIETNMERCISEININEEKISNLSNNIERIDKEISEITLKQHGISREINSEKDKLEVLNDKHIESLKQMTHLNSQLKIQSSNLGENEKYIENMKSQLMDKINDLSDKKLQINSLNSFISNLYKNKQSIDNEIHQLKLDNNEENTKNTSLTENISKTKSDLKTYNLNIKTFKDAKNELEISLSKSRRTQNDLKSQIQLKLSRQKMLQEMEQNFEGYHRSVKAILQTCSRSKDFGKGIHGALAQLIEVEKRYETAIEMALGSSLQNIITSNEEDAKKAIQHLKNTKMGRSTFLPISSVKGRYIGDTIVGQLKKYKGFCGIASNLLSYDPEYNGIILSLLGRVVVVDNIDTGVDIARNFKNGFKLVTLDGDIISTTGSMTGGSIENRGFGILSRSREINELTGRLQELQKSTESIEKEISILIGDIDENSKEILLLEEQIKNCQLILVRDESQLSQVNNNIKKISARIDMLTLESQQLLDQETTTKDELKSYNEDLSIIEIAISEIKNMISEHQEKHKEDKSTHDDLVNNITNYKISLNSISENIDNTKESINKMLMEKDILLKEFNNKTYEKSKSLKEVESIRQIIEGLNVNIKKYREEQSGRNFQIERIIEEKKVIEEELLEISSKIDNGNKNLVVLQEELGRFEVKRSKSDMEIESIQSRMWDEYELTYNNALSLRKDSPYTSNPQNLINLYRTQIKELGPVNVSSIDDYIKTKERYEFMVAQSNDMELAKSKLHRVIYEITSIMKKQFIEQFKLINDNFNIVFKELFGGGRARLILPDEENVLESGIDIEAQPPGKRLQNLLLLSGGERSFTAIALLFAILKLSPVPFCVLDEIEAALDEANVYRFLEYLKLLSDQTQFIMITHRKGTMEGSDMLYGVTMEEHGISKVVSIKFDKTKAG